MADILQNIFEHILSNEKFYILFQISMKFVPASSALD